MMEGEREQNEERKMRRGRQKGKKIKVEERAVGRKSVGGEKRESVCLCVCEKR